MRLRAIVLGLLIVGVNAVVAHADDATRHTISPFDVADPDSNYSKAFLAITNPVPKWLDDYLADRGYAVEASETLVVDGKSYDGMMICKPHGCDSDVIFLYYSPNGEQAWAALKTDGTVKLLGSPEPDLAKALLLKAR